MFRRLNRTHVPAWLVFQVDLMLSFFSIILAFLLRFNFRIPEFYAAYFTPIILTVLLVRLITFKIGGTYRAHMRHTSIKDFFSIIIIVFSGTLILGGLNTVMYFFQNERFIIPISILVIDFFICAYFLTATRVVAKFLFLELSKFYNKSVNVLVYGNKNLAVSVKRAIDLDSDSDMKVAGFVSHNAKFSKTLEGLDIFHVSELELVFSKFDIKKLILAEARIPAEIKNSVVEKSLIAGVKVLNVKNVSNWLKEGNEPPKMKEIKIEDLLERDPIVLDIEKISLALTGKCVMITGAAGSIGSELVRQIISFNPSHILLVDQAETPLYNLELELLAQNIKCDYSLLIADIANDITMENIFNSNQIHVVYHAAAYKHVPMMECNPEEAVRNNVLGTKIISDLAVKYKVEKFVMISTDKAVNPTNVMGASKRIAEIYTQSLNEKGKTQFITTRFGNVLGSNGSVIPLFKKQIENGGPVTVTHPEVTRYFMTIPEACQLVLEASIMGNGGEIFLFDMGKSVKITELAKNMIRLAGYQVDKDIQIKYVGLRPGEKLYEELLNVKENTIPTHHEKIMIAKNQSADHKAVTKYMDYFKEILKTEDRFALVGLMKKVVPEFKSQNSIFEELDVTNDTVVSEKKIFHS